MRTAQLEKSTGISRHTLRYYEREGLITGVRRGANNYREYSDSAVEQVKLLRQLQELGFSLQEIREILDSLRSDSIDCAAGAELMARKRAKVIAQIDQLETVQALLLREQKRLEASAAEQLARQQRQKG